jgi:malate dehydrogenase
VSLGVVSGGEYGVPEGLQFGFPVRTDGTKWEIVADLFHSEFALEQIRATKEELEAERAEVTELLGR